MRHSQLFIGLLALAVTTGCKDSGLVSNEIRPVALSDTLSEQVTAGIMLDLVGFQDSYSLEDTVAGNIRLINVNDITPLILYTSDRPPHGLSVSPASSMDFVYYYSTVRFFAEFRDTLRKGDTLTLSYRWDQATIDNLKAFSGRYQLRAWLNGNPLLRQGLTKLVTISESGDPLSLGFTIDGSAVDSVRGSVVFRNRIDRTTSLEPLAEKPITIAIRKQNDTLALIRYSFSAGQKGLTGHSDNVVLHFALSKQDALIAPLKGNAYFVDAIVEARSRRYVSTALLFLF